MISIIYGCLETARELTCSMSCLASRVFFCVGVSLFRFAVRFDHPPPHFLFFLHTPCSSLSALACCCAAAPALMPPVYLSAVSALLTGCACPHASSQHFLVDVAILVQLWHRRLTSTLARMCCPPTSPVVQVVDFSSRAGGRSLRPRRWRGFVVGGDVMKVRNMLLYLN